MEQTVKQRLISFMKYKGIGQGKFEHACGLSNGYINKLRHAPGADRLQKILGTYPEINRTWLLTGTGEMLNQGRQPEEPGDTPASAYMVPLLPVSAQAGSLNDFVVSVKASDCEMVVSPIKGAECAVPITGDSMSPNYPPGAQVMAKRINEKAFIEWGRVYVLDTCNGIVIKQVFPADDPDKVRCVSINTTYPPFDVAFSDIYGIYRVLACIELM
ncbi:S24 family peptidase [Prevotella sp. KH2C16]|uniref:S24 family peptidase n=1 Tax=Prevotella sp. KH2C16 TaxID=1855325 RepID=UPI0008F260FE|nr:S24 family peptidase [Prevotella sp. KH2C16]SFG12774.1 Phage repressor protein C, contains Cro/C1-type HTH and peptisase s24 domains [Prevotella sp. KH2C16]